MNQREEVRGVAHVNLAVRHDVGKRGLHDGAEGAPAAVLPRVRVQLLQLLGGELGLQLGIHFADFVADQRRIVQNDLQLRAQGGHVQDHGKNHVLHHANQGNRGCCGC